MTGHTRSQEMLDRTGLTYRVLDYWTRQGYLTARVVPGNGQGHLAREWPDEELRVARDMRRLTVAGLLVSAAHDVARDGRTVRVLLALGESTDAA